MEISQTFDGDSRPTKKTTIHRWEELVAGEVQIQQSTSTVFYLRSTVLGGKVIAELDDTGYKRLGYVFAGGMQIATQYIWNPGFGYDVSLATTSPATGSEYMVGGIHLGRKELDPLGADVTQPPAPMLIPEPIFYNPKFDQMPLQIEGGPSDEYEQANADWASLVTATIHAAQERGRAEDLWQSGKRSEALAILQRNPNVGIEYRALIDGEVVSSGSYFGQAAADFLNGLNIAVGAGLLSPVVGTSTEVGRRHHPFLQTGANPQDIVTATVYFWAPGEGANKGKGPVGHLSVEFSNGIYISGWPLGGTGVGGTLLNLESEVDWQPSYESDKNSYGRDADLSTKVGNIDAAAINRYWAFIQKNPGKWHNGRHCADIVAEALSYAGVLLNNTQPGMSIPRETLYIIQRDARRYKRATAPPIWRSNYRSVLDLRQVYD